MIEVHEPRKTMPRQTPEGYVQKSFHISEDNAEWLRNTAHVQRSTQVVLVNRAIETLRALSEGRIKDVLDRSGEDAIKDD